MSNTKNKKQVTQQARNRWFVALQIVMSLIFAYVFGSFAIDSGSYWHYLLAFISLGIAVHGFGLLRTKT